MSTWNAISSSTSAWTSHSALGTRKKRRNPGMRGSFRGGMLTDGEDLADGGGVARPRHRPRAEVPAAECRELVVLRLPVVLREPPLGLDPAAFLEAVERRVERPLVDAEQGVGDLADPARDGVAVARPPRKGLQNQHVERALEEIEIFGGVFGHGFPMRPYGEQP